MAEQTRHLAPTDEGLAQAAALLRTGRLVAFPTETVYGLGADARQGTAVAAIYAAKGRPSFNPLIVHVADVQAAHRLAVFNPLADALADAFWPGPLTLVLPLREGHGLSPLVTAGIPTVALRVPAHPTARALLRMFNGPVAAPSANPSGRISPTTAAHVHDGLGGRIAAIVDDGPCPVGLESTIVGFDHGAAVLLRAGGLSADAIETLLGTSLLPPPVSGDITAPGQLSSHYAPRCTLRLNAHMAQADELMLGFGNIAGDLTLSASGDLNEAAANLFGHLHELDALNRPIAVAPIPMTGLGIAINDRLMRAAAPRD